MPIGRPPGTLKASLLVILTIGSLLAFAGLPVALATPPDERAHIIKYAETPSASDLALISAAGGSVKGIFPEIRVVAAYLPPQSVAALAANPNVVYVRLENVYQLVDLNADRVIGADQVWSITEGDGTRITGDGVKVAVLDTGVDSSHPELAGGIAACYKGGCSDWHGHGTHVAGIVTANGVLADAKGVAPDASVYSARVCKPIGCFESDIIDSITWAMGQRVHAISLSLGGGNYGGHCDNIGDALVDKVNQAASQGFPVVVASGNDNSGVSSPACASGAIAVGATYHTDETGKSYTWNIEPPCTDTSPTVDTRACFSNFGPALDVMAPGVFVLSSLPGGTYGRWSGTSMATPHVSGVVALLVDANPALTLAGIKNALYSTARDLGAPGFDQHYGNGRVNAYLAVQAVLPSGTGTFDFTLSNSGGITVSPGGSGSNTITVTLTGGVTQSVGLSCTSGLPSGALCSFNPSSGNPTFSSTLTISTSSSTPTGSSTVTVTGTGGGLSRTTSFTLTVAATSTPTLSVAVSTDKGSYSKGSTVTITVTVTSSGVGVAGATVTLTITDPSGAVVSTQSGTTDANGSVKFTYVIPTNAASGKYTLQATATATGYTSGSGSSTFKVR